MLPGPTIIRKCSACGKLIVVDTIASGNTYGARYWTDGMMDAPMLPDTLAWVKCPYCATLIWINEQEKVGELRYKSVIATAEFKEALPPETPSCEDYLSALSTPYTDGRKERYIRQRAWWAGNDARRTQAADIKFSGEERSNIIAFAQLLDESDPYDLVMKAEAMRELGRFEDAIKLLIGIGSNDEDILQVASLVMRLAGKRDEYVREIETEPLSRFRELSMRSILDDALSFLEPELAERRAVLRVTGQWPTMTVNRDELPWLLLKLIGNALKYVDPGQQPEITINSEIKNDCWLVKIKDNGIGIEQDQQDKLFRYFTLTPAREQYEGARDVLASCRRIVGNHHHGKIWVRSAGTGKGATFCFALPFLDAETLNETMTS